MVDEVEITNVGGKRGVASEATLDRLADSMEELGKKFNVNTKELQSQFNKASKSVKDHESAIEEETEAREDNTSALKETGKYLGDLSGSLYGLSKAVVGTTLGAVQGLSSQLIRGSNELSDFAEEIPLIGNQLSMLTQVLDNSYSALNRMATSGGAFGYQLDNLRSNAARAGLSLQEFSGFVDSNAEQLAAFGGTVTQGARRTSQMVDALGDQREQLLGMGLSFEEINEQLQTYQYINRAGSRQETRTRAEQAEAAASLTKNMLTLSKLTGKDVKQMQEQLAQEQQSMAFQRELAMMPDEQRDRINQAMADIQQTGGQAAVEAFKAEFLGLPPVTRQAQLWTATQGENAQVMQQMVKDARNRDLTEEERNQRRASNLASIIENTLDSAGDMDAVLKASAAGVEGVPAEIGEIFNQNSEVAAKYISDSGEFLRDQFEKDFDKGVFDNISDPELTGLAGFKDNLREVRSSLTDNLINPLSNVVGESLTGFNGLLKDFVQNGGLSRFMETIGNKLDEFETWFGGWMERFTQDPNKALEELFQEHIGPFFARAVGKVGEYIGKGMVSGINNLFTSPAVLSAMTAGIAGLFASKKLKNSGNKAGTAAGDSDKDKKSGKRSFAKGAGKLAKGAARRFGPGALALGAFDLAGTLTDEDLSASEKAKQSAGTVGGIGGAIGGAAAGAAVGSAVPLVGTALGGLVGGGLGYMGGSKVMEGIVGKIGGLFGGKEGESEQSRREQRQQQAEDNGKESQQNRTSQVSEQSRQALKDSNIDIEQVAKLSPEEISKLERVAELSNGLASISSSMTSLSKIEGEMPFETLALSINNFKKLDTESLDKLTLVANSDLGNVFSQLDKGMQVLSSGGLKDAIFSALGAKSPFEKLVSNLNTFNDLKPGAVAKIETAAKSIEKLSSLENSLDTNPVNEYSSAINDLTEALQNLNSELANDNDTLFDQNPSAGNLIAQQNQNQTQDKEQLERLNNIMTDILGVLMQSNDMSRRQLRSTRSLTGDLHRGF